jgi:hypothetical protein
MGAYEKSRARQPGSNLVNGNLQFPPDLINEWMKAGFPGLGTRAFEVMPDEAEHWLEYCIRLETARRAWKPIPGLVARRGRVYVE